MLYLWGWQCGSVVGTWPTCMNIHLQHNYQIKRLPFQGSGRMSWKMLFPYTGSQIQSWGFNVGQQVGLPTGSLMDVFDEQEYTEAPWKQGRKKTQPRYGRMQNTWARNANRGVGMLTWEPGGGPRVTPLPLESRSPGEASKHLGSLANGLWCHAPFTYCWCGVFNDVKN